jgi:hypothetical protein
MDQLSVLPSGSAHADERAFVAVLIEGLACVDGVEEADLSARGWGAS